MIPTIRRINHAHNHRHRHDRAAMREPDSWCAEGWVGELIRWGGSARAGRGDHNYVHDVLSSRAGGGDLGIAHDGEAARAPPKVTAVAPLNPKPVIVTGVPPPVGPELGLSEDTFAVVTAWVLAKVPLSAEADRVLPSPAAVIMTVHMTAATILDGLSWPGLLCSGLAGI